VDLRVVPTEGYPVADDTSPKHLCGTFRTREGGMLRHRERVAAMARALSQQWGELRPGDHIAFIYDDARELAAFIVPFIKDGLAQGERCGYVVDDLERSEVTAALVAGGVDVNREIERGALVPLNAEEFYGPPPFDALRVVERIRQRELDARARGFTGLRIAVEGSWLNERIGDDALGEFESLLNKGVGPGTLALACLHRRDRLDPAVLRQVINSHAKVVAGDYVHVSLSALFQALARSDLQRLWQSAGERRKRKGEFYFHQGEHANEVYVLTDGALKLVRTDPAGQSVILYIVTPNEPFGHVSALGGSTRLASAQTLEDSRALVWDVPTILQVMMKHPEVSMTAMRLMVERIEEAVVHVQDLATSPVERRLARVLFRLAQSVGHTIPQGIAIELSLSGQDLAELTSTTPFTVSRLLAEWRRLQIVDAGRERILILNPQRIAAIAGLSENLLKPGGNSPLQHA
jgi:CRP/FNR family transcriptional regulator, nitrogen oxide reductase regulator